MANDYIFFTLLAMAAVTVALRAFPFFLGKVFQNSSLLLYIGQKMPVGVMCLLVIYTLKNIDYSAAPHGLPALFASILSTLLYWRYRNASLAIFVGLFVYLLFVNYPFIESSLAS